MMPRAARWLICLFACEQCTGHLREQNKKLRAENEALRRTSRITHNAFVERIAAAERKAMS